MQGQNDGQYYSNIYVQATPPAQFPAHLWGPSVQWPSPLLVTIHPNPAPNTPPLPTTTGEQLATPQTARTGTASGGPAVGVPAPWQPALAPVLGMLRAPRADELAGGSANNPATPLGLLGFFGHYA